MRKKLNHIKNAFLVFVISMVTVSSMYGQVPNRTKMQDATISTPNSTPHTGAVLELESNNRGMLVPRMTTAQRDAMPIANRSESLFIYNTTTGCFNYWSIAQDTWLSLCGTPPPAVFHITTVQCSAIVKNGIYKQGDALNNSNYLSVPVTVTQPGTYDVMATTANGYYFTTSGTFPNAGSYTIQLQGTGTPSNGYNAGAVGDEVTINLNGTESDCKPHVFVEKANVSYSLDCNAVNNTGVRGDYYIGIATTTANKLVVPVTVSSTGYWNMSTSTVNGVYFSGSGTFTTTTPGQTVELLASGTPLNSGTFVYSISTNSDPAASCAGINVTVKTVAFTMDCSTATVNGSYMQAVATTSANTITLPINVTATGQTTISTNTVNGISFSTGPITLSTLGQQTVTLTAAGTPTNGTATTLIVSGTPGAGATCNVTVPIAPQPVAYTMTCGSIAVNGSYAPGIAMTASNTMTLTVNATFGGAWSITTDPQNGVSFSGSGTLTAGSNTLTLTATGTPVTGGSFNYTLTSNSASGSTTCTKSVLFIYREMNVLGLGGGVYQPGSSGAAYSSRKILETTSNFGPTGTFPVKKVNIFDGAYASAAALKTAINTNNIDIIVIGYNYTPDVNQRAVLIDFVKNKKGVIIHSQENGSTDTKGLIDGITGGNVTVSGTSSTYFNPTLNVNDPILNGPFGDQRNKGTGSDVNNSYYVTGLPTNVTVLGVNATDSSRAHIFKDNSLGYLYIGDSGWTAGEAGHTSNTIWPAQISTTGIPMSKTYTGGTVFNSFVYANSIAWAIKYAQQNTITTYQIP